MQMILLYKGCRNGNSVIVKNGFLMYFQHMFCFLKACHKLLDAIFLTGLLIIQNQVPMIFA